MEALSFASFFGYAGVVANVVWPTMKTRKRLLAGQVVACCLMLCHFALLGAATGAAVMAVAGVQAGLAIPLGSSRHFRRLYLASLALTPIVCYMTWHGFASVYSSLALAIVCIANWQIRFVMQRALLIFAIFAWMAHNVIVWSVPALISNTLTLTMSVFMLYRAIQLSRSELGVT